MSVVGDIQTMPLVELLQWVASNKKTGLLELERNTIRKQISFQQGRVVGCFDDDPSMRLGQFLISRGLITDRNLRFAMRRQRATDSRIPEILVDMHLLTDEQITEQVKIKALETIYGVFEWSDAIFRFEQDSSIDCYEIAVDLSVERILLEGATREDDLKRIRGTFTSSGIVLRRTDRPVRPGADDALTLQVLDLVDGKHSLAEILTRAHASEYHVLKLLFDLMQTRNIEIVAEREVEPHAATLLDVRTDTAPIGLPSPEEFAVPLDSEADDTDLDFDLQAEAPPAGNEIQDPEQPITPAELHVLLEISASKLESGDDEGAMDILDACYRARPHDESLRQQIAKTQAACLAKIARGPLKSDRIPQRTLLAKDHRAELQPEQTTVLGMIDGKQTIESLVWVAPLRELQVLRALRQLLDLGLIRVVDAEDSQFSDDLDFAICEDSFSN